MDDHERGDRIKQLRQARRLTQPAVVQRMCDLAGPKPSGDPFIVLRTYQKYESGGGISWEKTRVLADVLGTSEDYILRGEGERRQQRPARSIDTELETRIARIEHALEQILTLLHGEGRGLEAGAERAGRALRSGVPDRREANAKPAPRRSRPASEPNHY
jgi:transcriptional regulator with XRE-family HTH domain